MGEIFGLVCYKKDRSFSVHSASSGVLLQHKLFHSEEDGGRNMDLAGDVSSPCCLPTLAGTQRFVKVVA